MPDPSSSRNPLAPPDTLPAETPRYWADGFPRKRPALMPGDRIRMLTSLSGFYRNGEIAVLIRDDRHPHKDSDSWWVAYVPGRRSMFYCGTGKVSHRDTFWELLT